MSYRPIHRATRHRAQVRDHRMQWLSWGTPSVRAPPLVLLHGWMDVGASFQFVVDALPQPRWVLAPDLRGFGGSMGVRQDHFFFPDYLADLDAWLETVGATQPVDLLGHSMGGHVAMLYAGVRPERVRRLINVEGYGMAATQPSQAPARFARWLDELQALRRGKKNLRPYSSVQAVAARLQQTNPRLPADKAAWLARHWAKKGADGLWRIAGSAAHKVSSAQLFRVDEVLAVYAAIEAPTLLLEAAHDSLPAWWQGRYTRKEFYQRLTAVKQLTHHFIDNAGHMVHHDQPAAVAQHVAAHTA